MIEEIIDFLKERTIKKKWRKNNRHNFTTIVRSNSFEYIEVGNNTYGSLNVHVSNTTNKLKIGSFCSIANNVNFILSSNHPTNRLSTYPFKSMLVDKNVCEGLSKGNIIVGDDVWICYGATILSGVNIGKGAIIGANSLVTKDVPPYAIVGGVPAKIIKYRFSEDVIQELMKIDLSNMSDEYIKNNIINLETEIKTVKDLDWIKNG